MLLVCCEVPAYSSAGTALARPSRSGRHVASRPTVANPSPPTGPTATTPTSARWAQYARPVLVRASRPSIATTLIRAPPTRVPPKPGASTLPRPDHAAMATIAPLAKRAKKASVQARWSRSAMTASCAQPMRATRRPACASPLPALPEPATMATPVPAPAPSPMAWSNSGM